jgi:hypothetical protein
MSWQDQEHSDGYRDGRDASCPEPNGNRSDYYQHSFAVGRAELVNRPIPASVSRRRIAAIKDPYAPACAEHSPTQKERE